MTLTTGSILLMLCSVLTGLIVEAIKKMTTVRKPNITAAVVSIIVGAVVPIAYILYKAISIDTTAVLYVISLIVLSWLCAMLGYDKVIQTLTQLKRG